VPSLESVVFEDVPLSARWPDAAVGLVVGLAGGTVEGLVLRSSPVGTAFVGAAFGLVFALWFARRCSSPGAGMLWGVSSALLMWCAMPIAGTVFGGHAQASFSQLEFARHRFPDLVANLLCIGAPVGIVLGVLGKRHAPQKTIHWGRAIVSGGFSGLASALIFGYWLLKGDFLPLIGGLATFSSHMENVLLQFAVAWLFGITFGFLFQQDVRGYGSSMGWGLGFALLCWFAGPLTFFPLLSGAGVNWSVAAAGDLFSSLTGYIFYGLMLGVLYATIDRMWLRLFVQSDPLNREPGGVGLRLLLSLQWGAISGFVGGVVSSPLMLAAGVLSRVAGVDVHLSTAGGLFVHLLLSVGIGMGFGLLFRDEASSFSMAGAWGWVFGLIWWYAGPLTLLPLVLTGSIDWRMSAVSELIPSIFGHIIYGAFTGFTFYFLEQRYLQRHILFPRIAAQQALKQRPTGTPAPALWFLSIVLGVALPILLG
jgi:hypothetical protein